MSSAAEPTDVAPALSMEVFLTAAISLKNQVVDASWKGRDARCVDPTAYSGLLGTAIMCLRAYEVTGDREDLRLCSQMVDVCAAAARSGKRGVTFLCGQAGIYAVGAVVANYAGDPQRRNLMLDLFFELANEEALAVGPDQGGFGMPYSLLHGRAGFLYAALYINKHLGQSTVPNDLLLPIVDAVLEAGRAGASNMPDCPLMYRWHGTRYWGTAHGLAGILNVMMHFPMRSEDKEDVRKTLRYMVGKRFGQSGNYPSSEGNGSDRLVQWSHGAGGVAITLCKAAQVFPDDRVFYNAAKEAGEVVWKRGLNEKIGLFDGIAGNAYTFLSLYKLTGEKLYLERARSFSSFLYHNVPKLLGNGNESKHSLFQGLAGVPCLLFDLNSPGSSKFPGFEL